MRRRQRRRAFAGGHQHLVPSTVYSVSVYFHAKLLELFDEATYHSFFPNFFSTYSTFFPLFYYLRTSMARFRFCQRISGAGLRRRGPWRCGAGWSKHFHSPSFPLFCFTRRRASRRRRTLF